MVTWISCVITLCMAGEPCREGPDQEMTFSARVDDEALTADFWSQGRAPADAIPMLMTRDRDLGGQERLTLFTPGSTLWPTYTMVVWPEKGEGAVSLIVPTFVVPRGAAGGAGPCTFEAETF